MERGTSSSGDGAAGQQQSGGQSGEGQAAGQPGGTPGSGQPGAGQPGQGDGLGRQAMELAAGGDRAGSEHTWEDQGTGQAGSGGGDQNRLSSRTSVEEIDDFRQLYESLRLEGAETLVTGVEGAIDDQGAFDTMDTRLTESDARSSGALGAVPEGYRDVADQALTNERVPPGYRDAVKNYFDSME